MCSLWSWCHCLTEMGNASSCRVFSLWPCRAIFMFLENFDIIIMGRKQVAMAVPDNSFLYQLSQAERKFLFFSKNSSAKPPDFLLYMEGYIMRRNRCRVFSFGLVIDVFEENDHNICEGAE